MTPRRQVPIRKKANRKKKAFKLPAPLSANIVYGDLTDEEQGGEVTAGLNYGASGKIRLGEYDPFQVAHELFHVLDAQVLNDADRARFAKILRTQGAWNSGTGQREGFGSPMEVAADYYAALATRMGPNEGVASYVSDYGPKRMRRFGNSLERLLKRRGLSVLDLDSYR